MPRRQRQPIAAFPYAVWTDLALRTSEMLVASAQVIGHRSRRIASAGHNPGLRDRREFARMGLEKLEAAGESWWAMGQQLAQLNGQLVLRAWQDVAAAGMAWLAFGRSRTLPQLLQRQSALGRSWAESAHSASRLSHATAKVARHGLKPIHARATANARRLGGGR